MPLPTLNVQNTYTAPKGFLYVKTRPADIIAQILQIFAPLIKYNVILESAKTFSLNAPQARFALNLLLFSVGMMHAQIHMQIAHTMILNHTASIKLSALMDHVDPLKKNVQHLSLVMG